MKTPASGDTNSHFNSKLLEFRWFWCPLWIRRVLVRAQEGQLKAPSQLWAAAALSFSVPCSTLDQATDKVFHELKSAALS
ncbi:MAG TPA: hypothetical protein VK531_05945, partial [Gemmatimonadales bacterium]|nr:hypothetical protein [Gemmatimonadales bacterium]